VSKRVYPIEVPIDQPEYRVMGAKGWELAYIGTSFPGSLTCYLVWDDDAEDEDIRLRVVYAPRAAAFTIPEGTRVVAMNESLAGVAFLLHVEDG
jgi:hypothetical protein